MVRVVYADVLFFVNLLLNYLMLAATARLSGCAMNRWRMLFSAAVGGMYCAAAYFAEMELFWAAAAKLVFGAGMVFIAFGRGNMLRRFLTFCGVSFAFGGCVFALGYAAGDRVDIRNGVYYIQVSLPLLFISAGVCSLLMNAVFKRISAKSLGRDVCGVDVRYGGRRISFRALCDSGNHLRDPITNRSVLIAEYDVLRDLFTADVTQILDRMRGEDFPLAIDRLPRKYRFRLMPYKTVGSELDMLLCFSADEVCISGKQMQGGFIAIAPNRISDGGIYSAICAAE